MSAQRDLAADEMFDSEENLAATGRLGEFLRFAEARILRPYEDADHAALGHQRRYRSVIFVAAVLASATLLATSVNKVFFDQASGAPWGLGIELGLAILSAIAVGIGLRGGWQKKWLLARYQAERYRLAKFELLTNSEYWPDPPRTDWRAETEKTLREIADLEDEALDEQAREERIAEQPSLATCEAVRRDELERLLAYYKRQRLALQIDYFTRASREKRSFWLRSFWTPLVFFTSMVLVSAHLGIDLYGRLHKSVADHEFLSRIFLFGSVLLPVVFSAMRMRHTANEAARNRNRSLARRAGLAEIARRLGGIPADALSAPLDAVEPTSRRGKPVAAGASQAPLDPAFVFAHLSLCEQLLEADQREWLRLMLQAEWYH